MTPKADIRLASISYSSGRPALLLPLAIRREAGLNIATTIGGKHANFNLPIFAGLADGTLWETRDRGDTWRECRQRGDRLERIAALA